MENPPRAHSGHLFEMRLHQRKSAGLIDLHPRRITDNVRENDRGQARQFFVSVSSLICRLLLPTYPNILALPRRN